VNRVHCSVCLCFDGDLRPCWPVPLLDSLLLMPDLAARPIYSVYSALPIALLTSLMVGMVAPVVSAQDSNLGPFDGVSPESPSPEQPASEQPLFEQPSPEPPLFEPPLPAEPGPRPPARSPLLNPASAAPNGDPNLVLQPPLEGYRLDTGDNLQLEIFDVPEFSNRNYLVLIDGSISVPWLGSITARGLTPQELANALTQAYRPYLKNPLITVNVVTPRPLRVAVAGEVNRPGSYAIEINNRDQLPNQWPDLTRALSLAGGITPVADIRMIRLRRIDRNNTVQEQTFNLWQLLDQGDLSQNILLRDGDSVIVSKATTLTPTELSQVSRANFSPDSIGVNIVGEVKAPGLVKLTPNASLNQAILAAGGFLRPRSISSRVDLIRLNPDGSTTARQITIDLEAGLNTENNPSLLNNDIIVVNTNGVARITDFLRMLFTPVDNFLNLRRLLTPTPTTP